MFEQSVTRLRAQRRTNRGGQSVPDWTQPPEQLVIVGVAVQPSSAVETTSGTSDRRTSLYRVYSEPGTLPDVEALDRIVYDGRTFDVEGEVSTWPDPFGVGGHHVEFSIKRDEGA